MAYGHFPPSQPSMHPGNPRGMSPPPMGMGGVPPQHAGAWSPPRPGMPGMPPGMPPPHQRMPSPGPGFPYPQNQQMPQPQQPSNQSGAMHSAESEWYQKMLAEEKARAEGKPLPPQQRPSLPPQQQPQHQPPQQQQENQKSLGGPTIPEVFIQVDKLDEAKDVSRSPRTSSPCGSDSQAIAALHKELVALRKGWLQDRAEWDQRLEGIHRESLQRKGHSDPPGSARVKAVREQTIDNLSNSVNGQHHDGHEEGWARDKPWVVERSLTQLTKRIKALEFSPNELSTLRARVEALEHKRSAGSRPPSHQGTGRLLESPTQSFCHDSGVLDRVAASLEDLEEKVFVEAKLRAGEDERMKHDLINKLEAERAQRETETAELRSLIAKHTALLLESPPANSSTAAPGPLPGFPGLLPCAFQCLGLVLRMLCGDTAQQPSSSSSSSATVTEAAPSQIIPSVQPSQIVASASPSSARVHSNSSPGR